jgi:c-di-AMP phosphodiesterase-like protein
VPHPIKDSLLSSSNGTKRSSEAISARSNGLVNVQLILEQFKGGGHFDSAGAQIGGVTMNEALERLRKVIDEYFDKTNESH